jgi:hypothetical protein
MHGSARPVARALHVVARSEADEIAEVGDEMRLVVVARVVGDSRPVTRARCQTDGTLKTRGARELFWRDADVLGEGATDVAWREAKAPSKA